MKKSVLIIDDEKITCEHLRRIFQNNMYEALSAFSGEEGLAILAGRGVSLVVVDLKMPGMDGLTFLREAKLLYPEIPIVVMTAHGTIETAVEAMKCGAGDFITKPFSSDEIAIVAERAIEREDLKSEVGRLRKEVIKEYSFENIISKDKKMLELFDLIKTVAETDSTVFIYGETGTGKELIAKAIHYNSLRRQGRFVSVNCGAISETLLESELFGHEKGAFTGALRRKEGRFELAEGGTLFLDEIGNISEHMQIKLLRVLQEKEFERVGGTETIRTDARIVSATNKNINELLEKGVFREDFYYRINVVPITIPSLRERKSDIPLLALHFLNKFREKFGRPIEGFSQNALRKMMNYHWPGNVRELENMVERAVLLNKEGMIEDVGLSSDEMKPLRPEMKMTLGKWLGINESNYLEEMMAKHEGNVVKAAEEAGVSLKTFYRKLAQYNIKAKRQN